MEHHYSKARRMEMENRREQFAPNSAMASSRQPFKTFFSPKRRIQPDNDEEEEEDNDFKPVVTKKLKLPTPFNSKSKQRNPFKAATTTNFVLDDTEDFRTKPKAPRLNLPNKKNTTVNPINPEKQSILNSLQQSQKQENNNKDKVKCPYCSELLFPMRKSILDALKQIEIKDKKHKEAEMKLLDKEDEFNMIKKRYISATEKDEFCRLHYKELVVKPDGYDKGYPTTIDFNLLPQRIKKFDQELKDIISNKIRSDYKSIAEDAYKEQGIIKARSSSSVIQRFQWSLPGYYGPKGSAVIIQVLSEMYLRTGYLKDHLISQQLPLEFIQQVLVPEAGFRLIRQDLIKKSSVPPADSTTKAKKIMAESCDYGSIVFPLDQPHID